MTPRVVERWLDFMQSGDAAQLHDLLDEEAVFYSPAVFTEQRGRHKTAAYLRAAEQMFAGTNFRYTDHWYADCSAILEFSADLEGVTVEGIDMIRWNDADKIVAFKIMVRPLKALQTVIPRMGELLRLDSQPAVSPDP